MKSLIKPTLLIAVILTVVYLCFDLTGCNPKDLKGEIVVLHRTNDSLADEIEIKNHEIEILYQLDSVLEGDLEEAKNKVKVVKVYVQKEVERVKKFDTSQVTKFYTERYPEESKAKDTLISLAKPVLISAAAELVELDGAKQIIQAQDSIVSIQDKKIGVRDSIITLMRSNEVDYKSIISNKDLEINNWLQQNKILNKQNNKLKKKMKIVTFGLIGVTGYFLLKK